MDGDKPRDRMGRGLEVPDGQSLDSWHLCLSLLFNVLGEVKALSPVLCLDKNVKDGTVLPNAITGVAVGIKRNSQEKKPVRDTRFSCLCGQLILTSLLIFQTLLVSCNDWRKWQFLSKGPIQQPETKVVLVQ